MLPQVPEGAGASHVWWALLALAAYSLVPPLTKVATAEIPSDVVVVVSNAMLVAAALALVLASDVSVGTYLAHPRAPYMYAAGVAISVGIVAYYRALALGTVSTVTPIFGLFLVTSSAIGVLLLDEPVTARKALGVALALVALYLIAGE